MKYGNLGASVIATFAERTSAAGARGKYRKSGSPAGRYELSPKNSSKFG